MADPATLRDTRGVCRQRDRQVTVMRHKTFSLPGACILSGAVLLLPDLVLDPSPVCFLIPLGRRPSLLHASHRRTRRAVDIAAIATPADDYLTTTTRAVEGPAVWRHLYAPTKGFTGSREPAMLCGGASTASP